MDNDKNALKCPKITFYLACAIALAAIFSLFTGGLPLVLVSLFFLSIGANEYKQLMVSKGFEPFFYIVAIISFAILLSMIYSCPNYIMMIIFAGIFMTFAAVMISKRKPYIANISTTILGFIFCWLPSHIILLSQLPPVKYQFSYFTINSGMVYLILLVSVVIATDFGAYFFGSRYGKRKLMPEISPNKTVFGAVAGAVCAVITSLVIGQLGGMSLLNSLVFGILITFCAQFGDFSVSVIKRDSNIKHSGGLFLDRGGVLDRIDSFIFSAPAAYYYFKYFAHLIQW